MALYACGQRQLTTDAASSPDTLAPDLTVDSRPAPDLLQPDWAVPDVPGPDSRPPDLGTPRPGWVLTAPSTSLTQVINLTLDSKGNTLVTGLVTGKANFGQAGTVTTSTQHYELFVAKVSPAGKWLWVKVTDGAVIKGCPGSWIRGITAGVKGDAFITGQFSGPLKLGQHLLKGKTCAQDSFVARLDGATGKVLWATATGGANATIQAQGIAVNQAGHSAITGGFFGKTSIGGKPLTATGTQDLFVARLDAAGALSWVAVAHAESNQQGVGKHVAFHPCGDITIAAALGGSMTFGKTKVYGGSKISAGMALARLTGAGGFTWALGAHASEVMEAKRLRPFGDDAMLAGSFRGGTTLGKAKLTAPQNGAGLFVARVSSKGQISSAWAAPLTGKVIQVSMDLDAAGFMHLAGTSDSKITLGAAPPTAGGNNTFAARVSPQAKVLWLETSVSKYLVDCWAVAAGPKGGLVAGGTFIKTATFGKTSLTAANADLFIWRLVN